jgi:hypothetical protein
MNNQANPPGKANERPLPSSAQHIYLTICYLKYLDCHVFLACFAGLGWGKIQIRRTHSGLGRTTQHCRSSARVRLGRAPASAVRLCAMSYDQLTSALPRPKMAITTTRRHTRRFMCSGYMFYRSGYLGVVVVPDGRGRRWGPLTQVPHLVRASDVAHVRSSGHASKATDMPPPPRHLGPFGMCTARSAKTSKARAVWPVCVPCEPDWRGALAGNRPGAPDKTETRRAVAAQPGGTLAEVRAAGPGRPGGRKTRLGRPKRFERRPLPGELVKEATSFMRRGATSRRTPRCEMLVSGKCWIYPQSHYHVCEWHFYQPITRRWLFPIPTYLFLPAHESSSTY